MKLQTPVLLLAVLLGSAACQSGTSTTKVDGDSTLVSTDSKGIGKYERVPYDSTMDHQLAAAGEQVYQVHCATCHQLDSTTLVGPGWKGVTERRSPEWIMNMMTNPGNMTHGDATAKALLEKHKVQMPEQALSDYEARAVLEFMRKNDEE